MKIIRLEAENIKRLTAVSITPAGDIVEISGKNTNGKTSVLDAIFWAIAGTKHVQTEPIRRGADKAKIKLDLGELIVTRTFRRQEDNTFTTSLKVENAEGASFKAPQDMLNALLSGLTFDPLEFSRKKPSEQFDMLRSFVPDVDFKNIDDLNRGDFEKRTEANRRMADARAQAAIIAVRTDLPEDTEDTEKLLTDITTVAQRNQDLVNEGARREGLKQSYSGDVRRAATLRDESAKLRREADEKESAATELEKRATAGFEMLDGLPAIAASIDVTELRTQLTKTQATNKAVEDNAAAIRRKAALEKVANDAALAADEYTAKIKFRNDGKNKRIAEAKMPVEGLSFGDGIVTFDNLPFDQASDAQQLRASIAIAMHMNSKLRVIRVRDGSLLDNDSFKLLTEMAAANECQVWVETVRSVTDSAIVIEDGSVRGSVAKKTEAA